MKSFVRRWLPLLAVVAVALGVRLAYYVGLRDFPLFNAPTGDTVEYATRARAILAGDLLGGPGVYFHSSPAYPYFLAALAAASRGGDFQDLRLVALVQLLLSAGTAALVYLLGKKLLDSAAGGAVAGLLYALSPVAVFYDGELLMDFLLPPVLVGVALLATTDRWSLGRAAAAGALTAFGALARPSYLLLLLPVALAIWFGGEAAARRRRLKWLAGLVVAAALVVAPCAVRNYSAATSY